MNRGGQGTLGPALESKGLGKDVAQGRSKGSGPRRVPVTNVDGASEFPEHGYPGPSQPA